MSEVKVNKVTPRSGTTLTIGDSGDTTNVVGTLQNNGAALVGDISSVVAGTNLSGGGTSGAVTINLADASTSAKGAASFSSDNFAASSGAVTIKDLGIATAELQDDSVTYAKMQDTGTANRVLGAASAGTIGEVQIATDMIADDAVTADKLANSINTAIAANTNKVTNATHSGEVTGATALTIADNIVDEANLKVSNSPTNGYFLSAQSGNTGGMTWAEAGGGGKILQVVEGTDTNARTTTSSSYADLSLNVSITPSASNSKILVIVSATMGGQPSGGGNGEAYFDIQRKIASGSYTSLGGAQGLGSTYMHNSEIYRASNILMKLDSPGTTSAVNYKVFGYGDPGGGVSNVNVMLGRGGFSVITAMEVAN